MVHDEKPVVEELLRALTLEEKVSLLAGKNMWETANVDRLGIPSLKMTDGPAGARGSKWTYGSLTTFIPCGISLAATFDPELVQKVGSVLGEETRRKHCQVLLAPTMNLSRSPLGGRNFEGYGEDPFLIGKVSTAIIRGIQSEGAAACMKHFIANDTETRRFNVDQTIDERTLREVYMKPFVMALDANPLTAMVSYPKINGYHADLSPSILKPLLREELQFDRIVMSDWGGLNSTVESLIATTDLEMPGPPVRRGDKLLAAIAQGQVDVAKHVDPSVRRILELLERVGLLSQSSPGGALKGDETESEKAPDDPTFHRIAREAAQDGLVLLKNEGILPLKPSALQKIAILGPNARRPTAGGAGSAAVNPFYITTPEECITTAIRQANPQTEIVYEPGIPFSLRPPLLGATLTTLDGSRQGLEVTFYAGHEFQGPAVATSYWDDSLVYLFSDGDVPESLKGTAYCYQTSGIVTPQVSGWYTWSVANTGKAKLFINDEMIIDNSEWSRITGGFLGCSSEDRTIRMPLEAGKTYRLRVDNVVTLPPIESFDNTLFPNVSGLRVGLALEQDERAMLDRAVDCARSSDVAVLVVGHNKDSEGEGGDRINMELPSQTDALVQAVCNANPNTIVVVQAASAVTMPWVNQARAIVMAWYQGQENGNALADALLGHCNFSGKTPITFPRQLEDHGSHAWFPGQAANDSCEFGEQVLVGYRHFDKHGIKPLWPFGYGLSYTRFEVSDIRLEGNMTTTTSSTISVHARISNVGDQGGSEVVQVYVSPSEQIEKTGLVTYEKTLAGFSKVFVPVGETKDVTIQIGKEELRWYDEKSHSWQIDPGRYRCFIGTSAPYNMDPSSSPSSTLPPSVPVACLNCREKHLKCDGNLTGCTRCKDLSLYCHFVPSRRGRRGRPWPYSSAMGDYPPLPVEPTGNAMMTPFDSLACAASQGEAICSSLPPPIDNQLVTLFFLHFHQAHPFLPPRDAFLHSSPPSYLLDVVQFISLHYLPASNVPDHTHQLGAAVQEADASLEKVQALLLLSIIMHARTQPREAKECLGQAIALTLEIQNPMRAESARRTWWEIFIIDTLLAAVQVDGALQLTIETPDLPLPCEMDEYQDGRLGIVPTSLRDMDRQTLFHNDSDFSSAAYRVEAATILRKCLIASGNHVSHETINILDVTISAWFHRLPSRKQAMLHHNGDVDQMIFQSFVIMHCASIYLHFPKSHIFCSRPPTFASSSTNPQIHTAKVYGAAVNLSKLASLTTAVTSHSPFFVCTLVLSSIVQLAIFTADPQQSTRTGRNFLALNIGVLKSMGHVWAIAAASMSRIRDVAVEVESALARESRELLHDQLTQSVLVDSQDLDLTLL
ncbi:putative beta-glucosidase precursor [Aspergillus pseudocaelatus]|uniref:beta-glucosidase n=1 Tax=Aspergillus pseudocaelatus TaxID=1825620 RepID=A0ABQ6WUZ7_9EURO|nr:putative beta-glucosidase precursor [Aspergillus pseudocaelatus]